MRGNPGGSSGGKTAGWWSRTKAALDSLDSMNKRFGFLIANHSVRFLLYSALILLIIWAGIQTAKAYISMSHVVPYQEQNWSLPGGYQLGIRYPEQVRHNAENLLIARLECPGRCEDRVLEFVFDSQDVLLFSTDPSAEKSWEDRLRLAFPSIGAETSVYMRPLRPGKEIIELCPPEKNANCEEAVAMAVEGTFWPTVRSFFTNISDVTLFGSVLVAGLSLALEENKRRDDRIREMILKQIDELHSLRSASRSVFLQAMNGALIASMKWPSNCWTLKEELYHYCDSTMTCESILEILSDLSPEHWEQARALMQNAAQVMESYKEKSAPVAFTNRDLREFLQGLLGVSEPQPNKLLCVNFKQIDDAEKSAAKSARAALLLGNDLHYGRWAHRLCVEVLVQARKAAPDVVHDYLYLALQNDASLLLSDARLAGLRDKLLCSSRERAGWRVKRYFRYATRREPTQGEIDDILKGDQEKALAALNSTLTDSAGCAWVDSLIAMGRLPTPVTFDHRYPFRRGDDGFPWMFTFHEWSRLTAEEDETKILDWLNSTSNFKFAYNPFGDLYSPYQNDGAIISTSFTNPEGFTNLGNPAFTNRPLFLVAPTHWDANALLYEYAQEPASETSVRDATFFILGAVQRDAMAVSPWDWVLKTLADQWLNYLLIRPLAFSCLFDEDQNSLIQLLLFAAGSSDRLEAWINRKQQLLRMWLLQNNYFIGENSVEAFETEMMQFRRLLRNRILVCNQQPWKLDEIPDALTRQLLLRLRPIGFERTFLAAAFPGPYPFSPLLDDWVENLLDIIPEMAQNQVYPKIFLSGELYRGLPVKPSLNSKMISVRWTKDLLRDSLLHRLSTASNQKAPTFKNKLFFFWDEKGFDPDEWLAERGEGSLGHMVELGSAMLAWFAQRNCEPGMITSDDLSEFDRERHGTTTN